MQKYNNGSGNATPKDIFLQNIPLSFIHAGYLVYSNNLFSQTAEGLYWTFRYSSATLAYGLDFNVSILNSQYSGSRGGGFSIRCLARQSKGNYGYSSGTASDSICPKGWRLPGYNGSGSYVELLKPYSNRTENTYPTNVDTIIQIAPLDFIRSGVYYLIGNLIFSASEGFYWIRENQNIDRAVSLRLNLSSLLPQNNSERGSGYSLRCLAR